MTVPTTGRRAAAALAVLVALTGLPACSGDPDPGSASGPTASAEPTSPRTSPTAPATPTDVPTATPRGSHVLGLKWNWAQRLTFDYIAASGGGATFAEVEWCLVEPTPGQLDWARIDGLVARSAQLGHEMMLKIRTGQCWATQPPDAGVVDRTESAAKTPSTMPVDDEAYLRFVRELVTRYSARGVHTYAVENEPDVFNFWAAGIDDYERLVRLAVPEIRAADPRARVLDAGMSSTGYGVVLAQELARDGDLDAAMEAYQDYYGRRIEGGASRWPGVWDTNALDSVLASPPARRAAEVMDATERLFRDEVVDVYQLHFYEPTANLPALIGLLRDRVGEVEIEAWEAGVAWPGDDYDPQEAADETVRLIATLLASGVDRIVYLPLAFTPGDKVQVFRGLMDESGEVLPAGEAFEHLTDLLVARSRRTFSPVAADDGDLAGLTGVYVDRTGMPAVAILWSPEATVRLDLTGQESAADLYGAPLAGPLEIGARPVVLTDPDGTLRGRLVG